MSSHHLSPSTEARDGRRPPSDRSGAELHFHILPGVDVGPATLDVSVELARLAVEDGTSIVVATPHFRDIDTTAELDARVAEVQARLDAERIDLELRVGSELDPSDVQRATDDDLARIAQGPAEAPWLLVEAPLSHMQQTAADLAEAAAELRRRGYGVLIGHPERSPALWADEDVIERELAAGSVLQLNASSLTGEHTPDDRSRAFELARRGVAAVVASDAHRPTRGPRLRAARAALYEAGIPAAVAADMTDVAPRAILDGGLAVRALAGYRD
jgi:protein-tyrosine phosphatase